MVTTPQAAAARLADEIEALAAACAREGRRGVLGLAAGRSPRALYAELVRRHRGRGLSFASLAVTSLDEYLGIEPGGPGTFEAALRSELIEQVDFAPDAIHLTRVERGEAPDASAARHEAVLRALGGVDLQLLGLGANGHVAFNEPGAPRDSRTRVVTLTEATRVANISEMPDGMPVPTSALTMGIGTIFDARRLRVLAFGTSKAEALKRLAQGPPDAAWPCTWLRDHADLDVYADAAAAAAER
ncbi:MAG: glucosamine-6-phosphate deaminase [Myxococcota bacterium]